MSAIGRCLQALLVAGLVALAGAAPAMAQAATPAAPGDHSWPVSPQLLAVGAGAIAGVVVFNILAAPVGTVPLAGGTLEAVPSSVVLGSRVIAAATASAGAIAATYLYDKWMGYKRDYAYLLTL